MQGSSLERNTVYKKGLITLSDPREPPSRQDQWFLKLFQINHQSVTKSLGTARSEGIVSVQVSSLTSTTLVLIIPVAPDPFRVIAGMFRREIVMLTV